MSDNNSIFDFLYKIESLYHNTKLKEVVDLDDDIGLIIESVKAYEEKNVIGFLKNTKTLVSKVSQTYVECKNEYQIM